LTIYNFPDKKKKANTSKPSTTKIVVKIDYDPKKDSALIEFNRKLRDIWRL